MPQKGSLIAPALLSLSQQFSTVICYSKHVTYGGVGDEGEGAFSVALSLNLR